MPLSEYEQRVLQQMEQQLRSEDPKLASDFGTRPSLDARSILIAVALVLLGLGALLAGVTQSWIWLGVLGFLLMLAGVMVVVGGKHRPGRGRHGKNGKGGNGRGGKGGGSRPGGPAPTQKGGGSSSDSFMKRQADKWERRQGGSR